MDDAESAAKRRRIAVAGALGLGVLVLLAAIFDIWPFNDESLTKAEFLSQGDAICKEAHEQYVDLQPKPPHTAAEAAVLTGKLVSISEAEHNDIRDLNEPSELTDAVTTYLEARATGIDLIRDAYEAAQAKDSSAYYRDLLKVDRTQPHRLKLARDIGFRECSKPIAVLQLAGG